MTKKNRFSLDTDENENFKEENDGFQENLEQGFEDSYDEGDDDNGLSPEIIESDKAHLINFLKYPKNKRKLTDFLEDTYKNIEEENVDREINRKVHEHESDLEGSTSYHKAGHIGSLMYQYLNMVGVESAFASGLQHTKSSMTKTVQQRVDEINTLLRGVGGFNRQIKASFSRSAVVYLEQEDPLNVHRERVVFTINLADFELRYPLDEVAEGETVEDGRTLRRLVWDEAVNTLSEIISNTGMKPKYVKNDKNTCRLQMRQYLQGEGGSLPDEYFAFDLRHINGEQREGSVVEYRTKIDGFEKRVEKIDKKMTSWWWSSDIKKEKLRKMRSVTISDKEFYVATTPDPSEMDTGMVFSIYVNTMKDYTLTKDKMQVIMTKFILAISSIATDRTMDQQVNTVYQHQQAKSSNVQDLNEKVAGATKRVSKVRRKAS